MKQLFPLRLWSIEDVCCWIESTDLKKNQSFVDLFVLEIQIAKLNGKNILAGNFGTTRFEASQKKIFLSHLFQLTKLIEDESIE